MSEITFQFATETRLIDADSALIRWRTDSEFSHVDIVLPDHVDGKVVQTGKEILLGARLKGGVQQRKAGYAPFSKTMRLSTTVLPHEAEEGYAWLMQQVGKPYDWRAIAGLEFHRNWRDEDAWFCSELAFRFAEKCNAFDFRTSIADVNLNWLSPRDLILVLAALKG